MPRQKDGHGFVADLEITHLTAGVCVFGQQEHRKQIATILLAGTPRPNDTIYNIVEPAQRIIEILPISLGKDRTLELIEDFA